VCLYGLVINHPLSMTKQLLTSAKDQFPVLSHKLCYVYSKNNNSHFMALCLGLPRWTTHIYPDHQTSFHPSIFPPSTMIRSILPVQYTCLTVFLHNLSLSPLWSTSWSGTLHFILHTFLHFFTQSLSSFRNTCHTIATWFTVVPRLFRVMCN